MMYSFALLTAYAYIEYNEEYGVGQTGSWIYTYISAYWPPRYHNFHHVTDFDYALGYWGPPPVISTSPGEGGNATKGHTMIVIHVYQGGTPIEGVRSEAYLPPLE